MHKDFINKFPLFNETNNAHIFDSCCTLKEQFNSRLMNNFWVLFYSLVKTIPASTPAVTVTDYMMT